MALPSYTKTVDDDFVNTWYEIRTESIDNILDATVMWLALREFNCLTPQSGSEIITRRIYYGTKSKQNITRGTTLQQSVTKRETMAWWEWAYTAIDINRALLDDQKNSGPTRIKSYIATRLEGARNDLVQGLEQDLFRWNAFAANQMNGLFDIIPTATAIAVGANYGGTWSPAAAAVSPTYTAGTFGNISKATNTWWRPNYKNGSDPSSVNLTSDMKTFWNTISANVASPNFIISDQDLYEYYEDEISDKHQIVRQAFNDVATDLGFDSTTFKGAPMSWTGELSASDKMMFLNMDYIELVYDPGYWFDMTEWMTTPSQLERVAYIISAMQLIDSQPRRHGLLDYAAATD
jgi:hypothetical protein